MCNSKGKSYNTLSRTVHRMSAALAVRVLFPPFSRYNRYRGQVSVARKERTPMIIGVPKEIKDHEYRVSVTPDGVQALRQAGHEVLVEPFAGKGSGYSDEQYWQAGARLALSKEALFKEAAL